MTVTLTGVPTWVAEGPSPNSGGNAQGTNIPSETGVPNSPEDTGAIEAIAVNPGNPKDVFVGGANGGVWETKDITANPVAWAALTDQFSALEISSLQFDPTDASHQTIVAGIGNISNEFTNLGPLTGLLKSTDDGNTWAHLGNAPLLAGGLNGEIVSAVLPRGSTILVGVRASSPGSTVSSPTPGLLRSLDGGKSFQLISGLNKLGNGQVFDMAGDPSMPNRAYVAIGGATGGVFRTDDLGNTWTPVTNAAITAQITVAVNARLSVSAAGSNPVYLAIADNSELSGIFRSPDLGVTFTAMDLPQTLDASRTISSTSAASPIVVTLAAGVTYTSRVAERVRITGAADPAADGDWTITPIDSTHFSLNGSTGTGGAAGGTSQVIQGINNGGQASSNLTLAADPGNANFVYIAGDAEQFPDRSQTNRTPTDSSIGANDFTARIFRGNAGVTAQGAGAVITDATHQWSALVNNGTANDSAPHADSRALVFDAGQLLYSSDGGIVEETGPTDATGHWVSKNGGPNGPNNGLQVTQFSGQISYDSNSDIILGSAQDTGTPQQLASQSAVYVDQTGGDGVFTAVDDLTTPGGNSHRYIGFARSDYSSANVSLGTAINLLPASGSINGGFSGFTALAVSNVAPAAGNSTRIVLFNGGNPGPGGTALFLSDNGGTATTTSAIVYTQITTGTGWNGVNVFNGSGNPNAGEFAITIGGVFNGVANQDVIYAGSGNQVFLRSAATGTGSTLAKTAALPAGAGTIQSIAVDPTNWKTAYVTDGSQVYKTTDAGATWTSITGNLNDTNIHTITVADNASGVSAILVGETDGVFRMLSNASLVWTKFGGNLPNSSVWGLQYNATKDVLVVGTSGRGAWEVKSVSTTLFTQGVLEIDGDTDFPGENDTIKLVLDPLNSLILDVFLNSATPIFTVPFSAVQKIIVKGLGGNDNLIVDRTNGDPVPVGGLTYDGGTHTAPGVDSLTVVGAGAKLATFMRDPVTPDAGTLVVDGSTITFTNSQLTTIGNVTQLTILGSSAANGTYSPDPATADAGTFVVGAATIKFTQVIDSTVSDVTTFAMIAPNAPVTATIHAASPSVSQDQIYGFSGANGFTPLTFFNIANFTLDASSRAVGPQGDSIAIFAPGAQALVASELKNFTVDTGSGNDVLTINADDLRLPVAGGLFTYDAGTGLFPDGTHESNLRGLTSLDRVLINADRDMTIADLAHQFVVGGPIPDDTPPQVDLSMAQGGSGLGLLTMFGVEVASLDGGASANVIDGSGFSGALIINGGGGDDTLTGGSGDNTIISGAGNSTLKGGNQRADGATNNILGGGGVNVLIAGPGTNRLIAGSGTTTMIGGVGQDTFIIPNPAGTLFAPIGGYEVIGAGNPGDVLQLQGGGNPDVTEVYTVGPLPDPTAPETIATTDALGLIVPTIEIPSVRFDGEISLATSFRSTVQPVTQSIRYSGLGTILDGVTAGSMFVHASAGAGTLAVDPSSNLTAGKLDLTEGGTAVASILFGNKGAIGVYGPGGVTLASRTYPTPLPIVFSPTASLADSTAPAPPSKLASSIVTAGPGGSPFVGPEPDLATAEVAGLYRVILGRPADSAGLAAAVAMVQQGSPLARVASGLIHSDEHAADSVGAEYRAYLGRSASAVEIRVGVAAFRGGLTEEGLAAGLLGSTEYGFDHPGDTAFVASTYLDTLGRPASSSEVAAVSGLLAGGMSRGSVIDSLLGSTEALTRAVDGLYLAILGRDADAAGSSAAVRALQSGSLMLDDLADQLAGSAEFSTRAKASVH